MMTKPALYAYCAIALIYLILRLNNPYNVIEEAIHDDGLFIAQGKSIAEGNWLGSYSQFTLMKGPGYPIFLAINNLVGTPIGLTEGLLYILGCLLVSLQFAQFFRGQAPSIILFYLLLLNPVMFPDRILRENIYASLSLICVAAVMDIWFNSKSKSILRIAIYGICLGWFWITREEGLTILPGLLCLIFLRIISVTSRRQYQDLKVPMINTAITFVFSALIIASVSGINAYKYGSFTYNDFKGAFLDATTLLNNVQVGEPLAFVPVPVEKRDYLYDKSPLFLELKPYLDGRYLPLYSPWGLDLAPTRPNDYKAGWFPFALRDAVASAGYYKNPQDAEAYYTSLIQELEALSKTNSITIKQGILPPQFCFTTDQIQDIPDKFVEAILVAIQVKQNKPTYTPSSTTTVDLERTGTFLGGPRTIQSELAPSKISGWFLSDNEFWLKIKSPPSNGNTVETIIIPERLESNDLVVFFKNKQFTHRRFSFSIPSINSSLHITNQESEFEHPLNSITSAGSHYFNINGAEQRIHVDQISGPLAIKKFSSYRTTYGNSIFTIKLLSILGTLYSFIIPSLSFAGLFTYILHTTFFIINRHQLSDLFILATALWALFFTRLVMLITMELSYCHVLTINYFNAAYPFLTIASLASIMLIPGIKFTSAPPHQRTIPILN